MKELPQSLFDIYALALPRGLGFGDSPPIGGWQSNDKLTCGVITKSDTDSTFGLLVMRRQVDHVWKVILEKNGITSQDEALKILKALINDGSPAEPLPCNKAPRPALYDLGNRTPSDLFQYLKRPTHHCAAWLLNQLYLCLPNPDPNWASDCQTQNLHTRLWEVLLLASFREQGLLVEQPKESPDFRIKNRSGCEAWIEAVTANPKSRFNHVGASPSNPPIDKNERLLGAAAVRFAKTLGNKLQRNYHSLPHVLNKPFIIAIADFHAPSSMVWSREALISYLYGSVPEITVKNGIKVAHLSPVTHLLGKSSFPAGLFHDKRNRGLSAIIFSNACTISKLNRVAISAGAQAPNFKYVRVGEFYDRTPGALKGVPFCLEITSKEYRSLWPQGYEPWSAELEVFHNPLANCPTPNSLLPEACHWQKVNGEIRCSAFYETSILHSKTIILNSTDEMPIIKNS